MNNFLERLWGQRTARRTGLTLAALLGILAIIAVAVRMRDATTAPAGGQSELSKTMAQKTTPPQVPIKVRFIEVPAGTSAADDAFALIKARWIEAPAGTFAADKALSSTNAGAAAGFTGILSDKNFRPLIHELEQGKGSEVLGEPEVTTLGGRRTQMRATTTEQVVFKLVYQPPSAGTNSIVPQIEPVETGPIIEVTARVLEDGRTIALQAQASLTEFLGYDEAPAGAVGDYVKEINQAVPPLLPRFSVREAPANVKIWDGQTVVLGKLARRETGGYYFLKGKKIQCGDPDYDAHLASAGSKSALPNAQPDDANMELFVFITANLVDSAGNHTHTAAELAFAQTTIPPQ